MNAEQAKHSANMAQLRAAESSATASGDSRKVLEMRKAISQAQYRHGQTMAMLTKQRDQAATKAR